MTDEEIVALIQKGNKDKFGLIIDRYQKKLFWYVKNLINQADEEVDDLVEDVLIKTYENIQDFEISKKFSSWIYRIAHNKAVDYMKKAKIKITTIEDKEELIKKEEKLMEDLMIENEKKELVAKAIGKLEIKYKEVILLYFFEDKNYEEISDILRIPTSNVGVLLMRGKEKLKKNLNSKI
jgi:RNA polymerase sigma-70 factor (ECF subfamily)